MVVFEANLIGKVGAQRVIYPRAANCYELTDTL